MDLEARKMIIELYKNLRDTEVHLNAIQQLFIEKDIITSEELDSKISEVSKSDEFVGFDKSIDNMKLYLKRCEDYLYKYKGQGD